MKKIMSIVGVGVTLIFGGCAHVPSGEIQDLESTIGNVEGSEFGAFILPAHNCADNMWHARDHLAEGQRVNGKFMNSARDEIDGGREHANKAAAECAKAQEALDAYIAARIPQQKARAAVQTSVDGVFFAFDMDDLNAESQAFLDSMIPSLSDRGYPMTEIAGFTDSVGSYDYNMGLSERRARAVEDYLISQGVPADRLASKGYGPDNPIASNDTAVGRAQNRRVELRIFRE